ncbi:hypothetical protein B0I31_105641 [Saccharothrix carnea]|uniref:Uncharacterized protein n=1 Tax=Saccharothrix carnea TaxID=1280637 RepID=A0A2P8IB20_SACCR|nr:hypothetical protein [Saccharothrix carnea]PSL55669.1 hypothetical protein B0I31_105641 [Saccharothrix carnea]
MDDLGAVPLLVSRDIQERIASSARAADLFFGAEQTRVRDYYSRTGDPRLALVMGESAAALARRLDVVGSTSLSALHLFLCEMCLAAGASADNLARAGAHLDRAREQAERATGGTLVPRILLNWYWLTSIVAKASGDDAAYAVLLTEGLADKWIARHAEPADYIPVVRQQVMARQELRGHLALLAQAVHYKDQRPLDYYRSVKRVMEFLTNQGHHAAARNLHYEFVRSFAAIGPRRTLIAKISFTKNLAHLAALEGNVAVAKKLVGATLQSATQAGLVGQVRQLTLLREAITQSDVRGALVTFRL